jgi:hypothetical protein
MGMLELPRSHKIGGQDTQAVYEITTLEEYAKVNDLTSIISVASGVTARAADLSLTDTGNCGGDLLGMTQRRSAPGCWWQRGKQVADLELGIMFVLCGNSALHTHIPDIVVFSNQDHRLELATGQFSDMHVGTDVIRLESLMSFLQIKSTISLQETRQVRHKICQSQGETAFVH